MNSFYSEEELKEIGFAHIGNNVLISKKASIYGAGNISLGNNVRIDDFCILSGKIEIGNYVHIAAYTAFYGGSEGIYMDDMSTVSSHSSVYAVSDDYSGETMTNPMIPDEYKNVTNSKVEIGKHVIVGTHSVILPGVIVGEGCSVGAMSLVNKSLDPWKIYGGVPCKYLKDRKKDLLELEKKFVSERS